MLIRRVFFLALLLLISVVLVEDAKASASRPVSFVKDLVPILADKCLTCHQETKARGKYRVDQFAQLLKAGNSEETPVTPKNLDESYLYHLLISEDAEERMPLDDDPLPKEQLELLKRWILEGAKFDGEDPSANLATLRQDTTPQAHLAVYPRPVPITSLAWSKDAKHWFSNGQRELLKWDANSNELVQRFGQQPERIYKMSFHPTQPWVAVAGGIPGKLGETVVTQLTDGKIIFRAPATQDCQHAVEFSPDGKYLATGGTDKAVRVFSTEHWQQLWRAEAHADWVLDLCFSPDSQWILSSSRDRTVRSYKPADGEQGVSYTAHTFPVTQVLFDADPAYVISVTSDGQGRRWKLDGLSDQKRFVYVRSEITQLKREKDWVYVAFANGEIHRFNFKNPKENARFKSKLPRIYSLALEPNGTHFLVGGQLGAVQVFSVNQLVKEHIMSATPGWKDNKAVLK